jgi:uncharacterized protein
MSDFADAQPNAFLSEAPGHMVEPANQSRMKKLVVVGPGGSVVCDLCHHANRPHTRLKGIIGWKKLRQGEGLLIRPSSSIHTAFVRFPIDAIFLDKEMTIVSIAHGLKPWRFAGARKTKSVLELAAGECKRLGLERGDRLGWAHL